MTTKNQTQGAKLMKFKRDNGYYAETMAKKATKKGQARGAHGGCKNNEG